MLNNYKRQKHKGNLKKLRKAKKLGKAKKIREG